MKDDIIVKYSVVTVLSLRGGTMTPRFSMQDAIIVKYSHVTVLPHMGGHSNVSLFDARRYQNFQIQSGNSAPTYGGALQLLTD